jgi:hypothetical protein
VVVSFANNLGCLGTVLVSLVGTLVLLHVIQRPGWRACRADLHTMA